MNNFSQNRRLNIVVVGRSGVGKSSFLNYAAGKKVFETGLGEPVTQKYFEEIDMPIPRKNVTYCLFDTKGLEAGNTEEWKRAIFSEIDKRDESDNIYDWFHTIIFCIDASAKRIQPFEVNAIKELAQKGSVLILLTKKDLVTPDIIAALKRQILQDIGDKVQVLSVCSVSSRTRRGESKTEGLEEVLRVSFLGLWEKMSKLLPIRVARQIAIINLTLIIDRDLSDLLAYSALLSYDELTNGQRIYPTMYLLGKHGIDTSNYNNRTIDKSVFESVIKELKSIDCGLPVEYKRNDKVHVEISNFFADFFNHPTQLYHESLDDQYYSASIKTYLNLLKPILEVTLQNFKNSKNIFGDLKEHKNIVLEVLKFYNDVNEESFQPLKSHKTEEAIQTILNVDYDVISTDFDKKSKAVKADIIDIEDCTFFSGDERREAERSFVSLMDWLQKTSDNLWSLLENFIYSYEAELHAYGQYCLRDDELYGERKGNYKKNTDFSGDILREVIAIALSDGRITSKEWKIIRMVAEKQGIFDPKEIERIINEIKLSANN